MQATLMNRIKNYKSAIIRVRKIRVIRDPIKEL
jgi:hypothetical protein